MFSDYDNEEPEPLTKSEGELKKRIWELFDNFEKESMVGFHRLGAEAYAGKAIDEAKKDILPQNEIKKMLDNWTQNGFRVIIVPEARCYQSGTIEVEPGEYIDISADVKKWFGEQ